MLKYVLKYDLKYIYKILNAFYALTLIFAAVTGILRHFDDSVILLLLGKISGYITIGLMAGTLVNNMMRVWARFIRNLYGDESYLTHTLPVSKNAVCFSKFLASVITMFTSAAAVTLAIFIAFYSEENMKILKDSLTGMAAVYDSTVLGLLLILFLVFFLEMVFIMQAGYTGIILGYRANSGRFVKSIVYGAGAYVLTGILALLILFVVGLFMPEIMDLFQSNETPDVQMFRNIMLAGVAYYAIVVAVFCAIDIRLFRKGVNVD